jgi:dTDP-glucose 4,6-dehydratase
MSILEYAKLVIELTKSKSAIIEKPLPEDDPQVRRPDITRAHELLGWEPKVHIKDGMRQTIEFFKKKIT